MKIHHVVPLLLLASVLATAVACPVQPPALQLHDIGSDGSVADALQYASDLIGGVINNTKVPGAVAIVVQGDDIVWSKGFGLQNVSNPMQGQPNADSVVRVASITKLFTSLMLFHLRDAGVVDLDDAVDKYTTAFSVLNPYNTKHPITLRELASHTSGLPRENPCSGCTEAQVLAAVAKRFLLFPQFTRGHYSNLGYALLGRTLGHAAAMSYEDYEVSNILRPMGMPHADFDYGAYQRAHMAVGVSDDGTVEPITGWSGWEAPAGGLFASANDMAQLLRLMFKTNSTASGEQILDSATLAEMLRPVVDFRGGDGAFGTPWEFHYSDTTNMWYKSKAGELPGYRSQIALAPELKLGVFVSAFMSDVSQFDPSDSVWTQPILDALVPPVAALMAKAQPPSKLPSDASVYVGRYGPGGGFVISIANNGTAAARLVLDNYGTPMDIEVFKLAPHVLRTINADPGAIKCRWLDDGSNHELAYFDVPPSARGNNRSSTPVATAVTYMGSTYKRV